MLANEIDSLKAQIEALKRERSNIIETKREQLFRLRQENIELKNKLEKAELKNNVLDGCVGLFGNEVIIIFDTREEAETAFDFLGGE